MISCHFIAVFFWQSCPVPPVLAILPSSLVLVVSAVLSKSCPCPVQVLSKSCPGSHCHVSPVLAVMSWRSCPGNHVLAIVSWHPVLAVLPYSLSWSSCPAGLFLPVLFYLSCSACHVLPVPFWLPRLCSSVLAALSWESCLGNLVLAVVFLFW